MLLATLTPRGMSGSAFLTTCFRNQSSIIRLFGSGQQDFFTHAFKVGRHCRSTISRGTWGGPASRASRSQPLGVPARLLLGTGAVFTTKFLTGDGYAMCKQAMAESPDNRSISLAPGKEPGGPESPPDARQSIKEAPPDAPFEWAFFWTLLRPQIHFFLGAVATALVVAVANVQIPLLLGELVNVVADFVRSRGDSATAVEENTRLFWEQVAGPAVKLVKVYIVQAGFTFGYITCLTLLGERLALQMRLELFQSLLRQDIAFHDVHRTGELVNSLTADVQDFKSSFKMCLSQGIRSITQMVGCGVSLYTISPSLAGATAVAVPLVIVIGSSLGSLLRALSRQAQHQVAQSTALAEQCLSSVRTVRSFASEDYEAAVFAEQLDRSRATNEALGFGIAIFQAGSNLFLNGVVLGTLWLGGSQLASGNIRPGDLMSFLAASQTIQRSLSQLSVLFGYYVRGVSAATRVFQFVQLTPTIPLSGGGKIPYHSLCGNIEFKDVSFSYPSRPDQEVLREFNLQVPAGKVVALVGESGAGKTTIAHLLERFYDVTSGSICIDGRDLRSLDPRWLRGCLLALIQQEPVLFHGSVMENIRYGRQDATDKQVMEAARIANADGFIRRFPRGYDTIVGERGTSVSGGQKQRIAIARALLSDPRILILDEATSALDAESERCVQAALEQCSAGRTVLIIAHRLSTVQRADLIAVMRQGKLVELGTHDSLKRAGGYYSQLIRQQEQK